MLDIMNDQEETRKIESINQKCNFQPKCQKIKENSNIMKIDTEKMNFPSNLSNQIIAILNSKYFLIKQIGKGSNGSVFLSYMNTDKTEIKNFYAIKIMKQEESQNEFINNCEVNFLEKTNHKNILKVYSHGLGLLETPSGLKQEVYYIIMEYLNHGSLLSHINGNMGFGEDLGRLLFSQLLDGLEAIHNSNIVHRDIKLDNIMISGNDYTLKYIDFGFATEKSNGYLTEFLGTPNYAAPELHLKKKYLGEYEDIFSLGVTLFIIITGHLPFILALPNDPLYRYIVYFDYFNYWKNRNIKVSPSFMELFNNLIAFDPSQRPSISEIRKSKWMQEINWDLLPSLNNELSKREQIKANSFLIKQNIRKPFFNKNFCNNTVENKLKNADEMLQKIREEKKKEVVNDIKNQLFPLNNKSKKNNCVQNDKIEIENVCNKKTELEGFIKVQINVKNLNEFIKILKNFLRNEGYNITRKDLENLRIEISNGETDVYLLFEKILKEIKISFGIINGNMEDFINFKKIMKKFNRK